ncbi:MAG: methylglutamate dehydrogenase [Gammaproteobacteria bacterium]
MTGPLTLTNTSARTRVGCKGPAAESWLAQLGIPVPRGANRYEVDSRGLLAARLATSEFLFESTLADAASALAPAKHALDLADMPLGVYPVLRQDFVIEIRGENANELFSQTCAVDLMPVQRESSATAGPVIMTSMIGVGVVLTCRSAGDGPSFTVWSDPSYSHYFWNQLLAIATELGGGAAPVSPIRSGGIVP